MSEQWWQQFLARHAGYLIWQMRRRKLGWHWNRRERLEIAGQILAEEVLNQGPPNVPRQRRKLLDRVVYRACRELESPHHQFVAGFDLPQIDQSEDAWLSREPLCSLIREEVQALPPGARLIVKLKWLDIFFRGGRLRWSQLGDDERDLLLHLHAGQSLLALAREHRRRMKLSRAQRGRTPSTVICWLLAMPTSGAVDQALHAAHRRLRQRLMERFGDDADSAQ